jgi:superfamily II DNA or RNA helicase
MTTTTRRDQALATWRAGQQSPAPPQPRQLRPRQAQAITDLRQAYRAGYRAPILVAPTGFGKTDTAVPIVRSAVARGRRVWFLAHLKEILNDTSDRLLEAGVSHGNIRSGRSADYSQLVQVVSVQTAARRDRLPPADLIIVDECHLARARSYGAVFDAVGRPLLLGLTATPQRLDGLPLGDVFDLLVPTCSTAQLIEEGLLVPIRLFAPQLTALPDLRGKEYNQDRDSAILSSPAIVGDALSHWKRLCQGRRGVAFCSSVAHAEAVAEQWRRAGYRAMAVHGDSDDADRREAIAGLRAGRLDLVACAQLWIAGVDVPEIDVVIWLRRTTSLTAWLQGNGRGLRLAPWAGKKDLLIIDHVGNSDPLRLDHPLVEHDWSLEGKAKKNKEQSISVKICPKCFAAMPSARPRCSECGHVFTAAPRQELQQIDGELIEREFQKRERRREQGHAQTIADLVELGRQRGMKNPHGWARHVWAAREAKAGRVPA